MLLHHASRHALWHLRMAHRDLALRIGRWSSVVLIVVCLGAAVGHALVGRRTTAEEDQDLATDAT